MRKRLLATLLVRIDAFKINRALAYWQYGRVVEELALTQAPLLARTFVAAAENSALSPGARNQARAFVCRVADLPVRGDPALLANRVPMPRPRPAGIMRSEPTARAAARTVVYRNIGQ